MKQKRFLVLIMILILLVGVFKFTSVDSKPESPATRTSVNNLQQKSIQKVTTKSAISKVEKKTADTEEIDCLSEMLLEKNLKCDEACLVQHLQNQGSDAYQFIEEGWFSEKPREIKNPHTKLGRFYYALRQADLLQGLANAKVKQNIPQAITNIKSLIQEDPQNAALYIMWASMEHKQNNKNEVRRILDLMSHQSTKFDSYVADWVYQIRVGTLNDNDKALKSSLYQAAVAIPNYSTINKIEKDFSLDLMNLGQLMVQPAINSKFKAMDMKWLPIEYALGYKYINRPKERWILPSTKQIFKKYNMWADTNPAPTRSPSGVCDKQDLDRWFSTTREHVLSEINM